MHSCSVAFVSLLCSLLSLSLSVPFFLSSSSSSLSILFAFFLVFPSCKFYTKKKKIRFVTFRFNCGNARRRNDKCLPMTYFRMLGNGIYCHTHIHTHIHARVAVKCDQFLSRTRRKTMKLNGMDDDEKSSPKIKTGKHLECLHWQYKWNKYTQWRC